MARQFRQYGHGSAGLPIPHCDISTLRFHSSRLRAPDPSIDDVAAALPASAHDWLWTELDLLAERWDVLRHPFSIRWSAGELGRRDLALYASEYDHAVVALASASRRAADRAATALDAGLAADLWAYADKAERHIALWRSFARGAGWCAGTAWCYAEDPLIETVDCARAWAGDEDRTLAEHLICLYAIELAQPRLAELELAGLRAHYGFDEGPATEYFRVRAASDGEYATLARLALRRLPKPQDPFQVLRTASTACRAHWLLLNGLSEHLQRSALRAGSGAGRPA